MSPTDKVSFLSGVGVGDEGLKAFQWLKNVLLNCAQFCQWRTSSPKLAIYQAVWSPCCVR